MGGSKLRFDKRVAIVTGAGGGLGRTYAIELAKRGCAVVVNDLGGGRHGEGSGSSMADKVVSEIKAAGGKAVANYDSVENGENIVKTAIDNFKRIDIVINNAGILRDKAFVNMSDTDWDLIYRVHVRGAYAVTKAAWPYMRQQKYGRIIMTSSNAGIYGNFGQANYAMAKLGLVGFSNSLAREGAKYNIKVNALVPTAGSRLTQTVMAEEIVNALKPEYVTPMVVYMVHDDCEVTGTVLEAGGGWYGQLQWYRSNGKVLNGVATTAEDIRDNLSEITDMTNAEHLNSIDEASATAMSAAEESNSKMHAAAAPAPGIQPWQAASGTGGGSGKMNPELAKKSKVPPATFEYTSRDAIIYAIGIGAGRNDLPIVFESDDKFGVFPTYVVAPAMAANMLSSVAGIELDLSRILHGEQYIEIFEPLPVEGKLKSQSRVVDILDKGSGALIISNVDTFDAISGHKLATNQFCTFQVGSGKFGGARSNPEMKECVAVPTRKPDVQVEQKTREDQAVLYRHGSGDLNPLHIDANFASVLGFKQPILHGLCTLGFSVRHVIDTFADGDHTAFKAVKVRFSKPVIPGQTLVTEMWRGDNNRVHFQTRVKETGELAITNAYVDFNRKLGAEMRADGKKGGGAELNSSGVFDQMGEHITADHVKKVNGIFTWVITKNGKEAGKWTVDLKSGKGEVYEGEPKNGAKATTTLTLDDDDMVKLVGGQLNPQQAFMSGKLKIKGNIMLTQKLQTLFNDVKAKM